MNTPNPRNRAESWANTQGELTHVVDSLRRTYNMYKESSLTYSKQLAVSSFNRSLFRQHEFKSKLKH